MTIKRAILIGTLSAITITLIAFGIKANVFKPKTTTPSAHYRSAIRVDAEEIQQVSYKWLIKNQPTFEQVGSLTTTNINFTIPTSNITYTKIKSTQYSGSYSENAITYNSTDVFASYYTQTTTTVDQWYNFGARIPTFETQPNGNLYTWLNSYATPCYNGDALIAKGTSIHEIRKASLPITDYENGAIMTNTGMIQIFLDAGTSTLKINNITQNNFDGALSITNNDIVIETTGTNTGTVSHVFTISYSNTRPEWVNPPYPDPGDQVVEVIPIMPMMFKILTMPFTFISQAFNVTLWEGTPYQFNFSNFILSIIAIATLLFIIRLFTSGFSIIGNYTGARNDKSFKKSQTRLNNAKAKNIENNTPKKTESHVTIKKEK